jgi:hypothetical protein
MRRKLRRIEVANLDFIRFFSSCRRGWLSAVIIDGPDNGQDRQLPINFSQLPDFEA